MNHFGEDAGDFNLTLDIHCLEDVVFKKLLATFSMLLEE